MRLPFVFNDKVQVHSCTLQCWARLDTVNALLDWMEGIKEEVTISEDNVDELRNLCKE